MAPRNTTVDSFGKREDWNEFARFGQVSFESADGGWVGEDWVVGFGLGF